MHLDDYFKLLNNIMNWLNTLIDSNNLISKIYDLLQENKKMSTINTLGIISIPNNILRFKENYKDIETLKEKFKTRYDKLYKENNIYNDKVLTNNFNTECAELDLYITALSLFQDIFILFYKKKVIDTSILVKLVAYQLLFQIVQNERYIKFKPQYCLSEIPIENLVYLDYNIFSHYDDYKENLEEYLKNDIKNLVFSPAHTEEHVRRILSKGADLESIGKTLNIIKHLTNSLVILPNPIKKTRTIGVEEFEETQKRTSKELLLKIDEICFFLNKELKDINEDKISKNESLNNFINSHYKLKELFNSHSILCSKNLKKIRNQIKNNKIDYLLLDNFIYALLIFLHFCGVKRDSSIRCILSSLYDFKHIFYAATTKSFITADKLTFERAKLVYEYLGIKTQVFLIRKNKDKQLYYQYKSTFRKSTSCK